jgi:hypothetical protein
MLADESVASSHPTPAGPDQGTLQLSIALRGVTVLCAVACETDKKQSEASQPDYDHGGNRNWPAFRCAIYKPTVKRAMGYDETLRF